MILTVKILNKNKIFQTENKVLTVLLITYLLILTKMYKIREKLTLAYKLNCEWKCFLIFVGK